MPFPQVRVFGLLTDNWVAEVIHYRSNGEDAAQPLDRLFSGSPCWAWAKELLLTAKAAGAAVSANPAITFRLVTEEPVMFTSI